MSKLPQRVTVMPRLKKDLRDLMQLFEGEEPPYRLVWVKSVNMLLYDFGDNSGSIFVSSYETLEGIK